MTGGEAKGGDRREAVDEAGSSTLGSFLARDLRPRVGATDEVSTAPTSAPNRAASDSRARPTNAGRRDAHEGEDEDEGDELRLPVAAFPGRWALLPTVAGALSVFVHLSLIGVAAVVVAHLGPPTERRAELTQEDSLFEVELPAIEAPPRASAETAFATRSDNPRHDHRAPRPDDSSSVAYPTGSEPIPRPDTADPGRGGTDEASAAAINLAARADRIALDKDPQSRLDRSQVQRLRSARERASLDDRRATLQPMEVTFLASGDGTTQSRRPLGEDDPARGKQQAAPAAVLGAKPGATSIPPGEGAPPRDEGARDEGVDHTSPGVGLIGARAGTEHHLSADAAFARPWITEGRPAVPADAKDTTRDTVDSTQEVASIDQALLLASTPGGARGNGLGGQRGPLPPAAGGQVGVGTTTLVLGQGTGQLVDLDGNDPRLSDYRRRIMAKIHPLWKDAFPHQAALEGRQGRTILTLSIAPDGTLTAVSVNRPSGVPAFDENVKRAVQKAAPFPPIPKELSAHSMRWSISFDARNPAVR
jgi:TonB family protein